MSRRPSRGPISKQPALHVFSPMSSFSTNFPSPIALFFRLANEFPQFHRLYSAATAPMNPAAATAAATTKLVSRGAALGVGTVEEGDPEPAAGPAEELALVGPGVEPLAPDEELCVAGVVVVVVAAGLETPVTSELQTGMPVAMAPFTRPEQAVTKLRSSSLWEVYHCRASDVYVAHSDWSLPVKVGVTQGSEGSVTESRSAGGVGTDE